MSGLFSGAAFRFAHSILVPEFNRLDSDNQPLSGGPLSIRDAFFNATAIKEDGIEPYLRGMSSQVVEEFDATVISELRNFLFGPPGSGGMDLVALNIQRGRDLGLPSYNRARQDFGLAPVTSFDQISSNVNVQNALASVYPSVNDIDVWVGGLAEDHVADAMVGELFRAVMVDQFVRTRNADRFWFENSQFTATELASLRSQTMSDLIVRNTSINSLPANVFTTASSPSGFGAGGSAAATPPSEYRSMNGSGNNLADPSLGQTGTNLLTNYSLDYGDGISTPAGADRVSARQISNSVFAGSSGQANSLSATTLFAIWGQLLTHDTNLTPGGTDNALKIFGNLAPAGTESYPFVAEKLPLMFENPVNIGANNTIARPIYLPALNTADAVTINPNVDTTVTVPISAGDAPATVFVRAGTLETRQGNLFTGQLSITEVPASLTPISLPVGMLPDTVVTIQPGEMIFTEPAPLTLPNRANLPAGFELDLWSINPITGTFEEVGKGRVSDDRSVIETFEGGIRNSSWHFFLLSELNISLFKSFLNPEDGCEPCEKVFPANSIVKAHSGEVVETHILPTYQSLGETRGVQLVYSSFRADPRPIIHDSYELKLSFAEPFSGDVDVRVISSLSVSGNNLNVLGEDHYWSTGPGPGRREIAILADLSSRPSGVYNYTLNTGILFVSGSFGGPNNLTQFPTGVRGSSSGQLVHVNSADSAFGSGWELAGLQYLVENTSGSVLLVDGDGSEILFELASDGLSYDSPPGHFSTLEKLSDGTFRHSTIDRTVSTFDDQNRLIRVVDRNGNETVYSYNNGQLVSMTDPVGLVTTFQYTAGKVTSIVDPANRTTRFEYDANGNMIRVTDPDGTTRTWGYDDTHHIVSEIDKRGFLEVMEYDFAGRAQQATRKDGSVLQYRPTQVQGLSQPALTTDIFTALPSRIGVDSTSTFVDGNGNVIEVELNNVGQSLGTQDGIGSQGTVRYNDDLLAVSVKDARGFETQFTYDDNGNLISILDSISSGGNGGVSYASPSQPLDGAFGRLYSDDLNVDGVADFINDGVVYLGDGDGGLQPPIFLDSTAAIEFRAADMNGDGRKDIIGTTLMESSDGNGSLFVWFANVDGTYADAESYETQVLPGNPLSDFDPDNPDAPEDRAPVEQPGLAIVDFNNDGFPDVVLTQPTDEFGQPISSLVLLMNTGGGILSSATLHADSNLPESIWSVEAADLDHDGNQDLIVTNTSPVIVGANFNDHFVSVLLGDGLGGFSPASNYSLGVNFGTEAPTEIQNEVLSLEDFNLDGELDVVVASSHLGFVSVMLGDGFGGFDSPNIIGQEFVGIGNQSAWTAIETADFNGDNIPDIAVTLFDGKQIAVFLGNGNGAFSARTDYKYDTASFYSITFDNSPDGLYANDFDDDGVLDLVTAGHGSDLAYLKGVGDGTFISWSQLDIVLSSTFPNSTPEQIETIDLDNDGLLDIVTRTYRTGAEVRFGIGNGTFADTVVLDSGSPSNDTGQLAFIDANGDGYQDIVFGVTIDSTSSTPAITTFRLFINNGDRTFNAPVTLDFGVERGNGLASGDFNNDGHSDLIVTDGHTYLLEPSTIKIALGDGTGAFTVSSLTLSFFPEEVVCLLKVALWRSAISRAYKSLTSMRMDLPIWRSSRSMTLNRCVMVPMYSMTARVSLVQFNSWEPLLLRQGLYLAPISLV